MKCSSVVKMQMSRSNRLKKVDRFKNADCWYIKDCDHDLSLYKKMLYFWVFIRNAIMITILTKIPCFQFFIELRSWSQYSLLVLRPWSQSSLKYYIFESLYMTATMITIFIKMSCFWVFIRTAIMIVVLTKI